MGWARHARAKMAEVGHGSTPRAVKTSMKKQRPKALRAAGFIPIAAGILLLLYDPGAITVSWETASELNTKGFNLFRAEGSPDAQYEQINAALIPAHGDPVTGASYRVVDEEALASRWYYYQIEEVEWSGSRSQYPETVRARSGVPKYWLVFEAVALIFVGAALLYALNQEIGSRHQSVPR